MQENPLRSLKDISAQTAESDFVLSSTNVYTMAHSGGPRTSTTEDKIEKVDQLKNLN